MADEIKVAQDLSQILQGVVWTIFAVLLAWKGLPAVLRLVHELGMWRGEVGTRLTSIETKTEENLNETRTGFRDNTEQHRELRQMQGEHGERLASLESNGCGGEFVCPLANGDSKT